MLLVKHWPKPIALGFTAMFYYHQRERGCTLNESPFRTEGYQLLREPEGAGVFDRSLGFGVVEPLI